MVSDPARVALHEAPKTHAQPLIDNQSYLLTNRGPFAPRLDAESQYRKHQVEVDTIDPGFQPLHVPPPNYLHSKRDMNGVIDQTPRTNTTGDLRKKVIEKFGGAIFEILVLGAQCSESTHQVVDGGVQAF